MTKLKRILEDKRIYLGVNKVDFVSKYLKIAYPTYQTLIGENRDINNIQMDTLNKISRYLGISNVELLRLARLEEKNKS